MEKSMIIVTGKDYITFYLDETAYEYGAPRGTFFTKHDNKRLIEYLNQLKEEGFNKLIFKNE